MSSLRDPKNHEDRNGADERRQEENQSKSSNISQFLPTSRRIVQFSNGKAPGPNACIVYIDGAFDLFHAGHVEILKRARKLGDFLLVGIHTDENVSRHRGNHYPIMHLHERSLSVLACSHVDEVIIGAPWQITKDMITTFNISMVVHGTVAEYSLFNESDPYEVPKNMGIFHLLESPKDITTTLLAQRIMANHEAYMKRNAKKGLSEKRYYEEKKYVSGE
ncbi:putative ethanolamine-phosphate cytidylyltransferase [Lupinus albus]|uniref:ethanolamine-phosphate cytidylyltransferase n=1 Tax=Lupinus albus TaxID=3870 RepID=A0A6A4QJC1_LUPAL|nr:putative ethanolamine-phosphate cytidylyltransferase [Lupinus albus]